MTDEKKKPHSAGGSIHLNLGGILSQLGEVFGEAVQKLSEAGEAAAEKVTDAGPLRTHTGVRVRVGGLPIGSARPAKVQPVNPERPAPAGKTLNCELIEDGAGWILTTEMPGVAPDEVCIAVDGQRLSIRTTGSRIYSGVCELPRPIAAEAISISLVNGILTLRASA